MGLREDTFCVSTHKWGVALKKGNFRTTDALRSVNAVDLTERDIKKSDRCTVRCHFCGGSESAQLWPVLMSSLRLHGFPWRCEACYSEWASKERPRKDVAPKSRTQEELEQLGLVDTTARPILQNERVLVVCVAHPTEPKPAKEVIYNNLVGSFRRCGVAWRCPDCVKAKLSALASAKVGDKNPFYGKTHTKETKARLRLTSQVWSVTEEGKQHAQRFGEMVKSSPNSMTNSAYRQAQWEATHTSEFLARASAHAKELGGRAYIKQIRSDFLRSRMMANPESFAESRAKAVLNAATPEARFRAVQTILDNGGYAPIQEKIRQVNLMRIGFTHHMKDPAIRRARLHKAKYDGASKRAAEMLCSRGYDARTEVCFDGFNKLWDVVVYENDQPVLAIDVDGKLFHGHGELDTQMDCGNYYLDPFRCQYLPEAVPFVFLDANNLRQVLRVVSSAVSTPLDQWHQNIFDQCWGKPFPYPVYTDEYIKDSWEKLKGLQIKKGRKYKTGNALVTNFHPSIYHANVKGKQSPINAWQDESLLRRCIENRAIYCDFWDVSSYTVARGFEASKIAPRVSMFPPYLARYLLGTYAPDAKTVVDPFAGFSGRMLGALSLGMSYTGYDINDITLDESRKLLAAIGETACLFLADSMECDDAEEYDVLITCPPYGDKERWCGSYGLPLSSADAYVSNVLHRFRAKTYIFVVDKTQLFQNHVVHRLVNASPINKSEELVLVFPAP